MEAFPVQNIVLRCGNGTANQSLLSDNFKETIVLPVPRGRSRTLSGAINVLEKTALAVEAKLPGNAVTVTESEIYDSESDSDTAVEDNVEESWSLSASLKSLNTSNQPRVIQDAFENSKAQWIDDPIIRQWRESSHPIHRLLSSVNVLYHSWQEIRSKPFYPFSDPLWLSTGTVLREIGLPWHNNQINMPDEIDTSWPFHFKNFETDLIRTKGSRVGDSCAAGYVCNSGEANAWCLRALQQELRIKSPGKKPLLVYDHIDYDIVESAQRLFGLEIYRAKLSEGVEAVVSDLKLKTQKGSRPVIYAATLASNTGEYDDLVSVRKLSHHLPLLLHIDASRNFDHITTLNPTQQKALGFKGLRLGITSEGESLDGLDGSIVANTIVAGGPNHTIPAAVLALKPATLGSKAVQVAYTRASDSTLAGSRDALAPLWLALQELRFGSSGFNEVYRYCAAVRTELMELFHQMELEAVAPPYSSDIIVRSCSKDQVQCLAALGGVETDAGTVLLSIQPSVEASDVKLLKKTLVRSMPRSSLPWATKKPRDFATSYNVPYSIVQELQSVVHNWKVATRSAAGYPFHMGSYSALGPVIAHFLDVQIPHDWISIKENEVLQTRMNAFGLHTIESQSMFRGAFTNGSTMGNRVGIHTALAHFPDAYVYFSKETHYSVIKTLRDCDELNGIWSNSRIRYAEIPCDSTGAMRAEKLVEQALADQLYCQSRGRAYQVILFMNMGTTFVGARDDLQNLRRRMSEVGIEVSYVHLDGALDFGFESCGIALGPPGITEKGDLPVVQGVTLSHHKAMGNMVSGEVLCYSPRGQLATLGSAVDPRAIFETWLYMHAYTPGDLVTMSRYCQSNAKLLQDELEKAGVVTKRNRDSLITVLERPPAWITEEFSLRPEGNWVHFISMPHVSPDSVRLFVDRIAWVDQQCQFACAYVKPALDHLLEQSARVMRVQCRSSMAEKIRIIAQSATTRDRKEEKHSKLDIEEFLVEAMSFVVLNAQNDVEAVFFAGSTPHRQIRAGPVLINANYLKHGATFVGLQKVLLGFVARHLYAPLLEDIRAYNLYHFQT